MNYKTKSVAVYDNGLFVELAVTLAKSFGKVYYYMPWESGFPKSNNLIVGKGLPGVERVNNFFDIIDDVDLFVFPDIYASSLQLHLEGLGKRVFGSRSGDQLELDRGRTKQFLSSLGLPVGKWEKVVGFANLRKYLKEHKEQWVKINTTRGDMETFFSKDYKLVEPRLDELEHALGAKKLIMEFIVEDNLKDTKDLAYDGYTIDGKFPNAAMTGVEVKDKGYVGVFKKYEDLPSVIKNFNKAIAPTLKKYRYRNFFSPELRVAKNGIAYMDDACCRFGSPPSEVSLIMLKNLPDIMWNGAVGICVDPEPAGEFAVELLIHSSWADKNWQPIDFPASIRDNVKLRNLTMIQGRYYVVPQAVGLPEIGAVVAVGKTFKEAVEKVKFYASQIEGHYIDIFTNVIDEAQKEITELESYGVVI
jgi:hypothetical protein